MPALATPIEVLDGATDDTKCGEITRLWLRGESIGDDGSRIGVEVNSSHNCLNGPAIEIVAHVDITFPGQPMWEPVITDRANLVALAGLLDREILTAMIEAWDRAALSYQTEVAA